MSAPKIEYSVPFPPQRGRAGLLKASIRELAAARVGASVFFADAKRDTVSSSAYLVGGSGWYSVRTVTEHGVDGIRIWKIAEPQVVRTAAKGVRK